MEGTYSNQTPNYPYNPAVHQPQQQQQQQQYIKQQPMEGATTFQSPTYPYNPAVQQQQPIQQPVVYQQPTVQQQAPQIVMSAAPKGPDPVAVTCVNCRQVK